MLLRLLVCVLSLSLAATAAPGAGARAAGGSWPGSAEEEGSAAEEPVAVRAARALVNVDTTLQIGGDCKFVVNPGDNKYTLNMNTDPGSIKIALPGDRSQLKVYRPAVFNNLRRHAGISDLLYTKSLNFENLVCLSSDSKSGQAFWKSNDDSLVVKTLKHYEAINLLRVLDKYAAHTLGDISCIASVVGLYRVKLRNGAKKYFIVCKNVYPRNTWHVVGRFDLKGSTVGRLASPTSTVKKDLDLMASSTKLSLGPARDTVLHALQRDVNFLRCQRFMDYSMLVAVEKYPASHFRRFLDRLARPLSHSLADRGKLVVLGGDGLIYHIGIIDFLQRYTFRKVLETFIKGWFNDARQISCVAPALYAKRMFAFICDYSV